MHKRRVYGINFLNLKWAAAFGICWASLLTTFCCGLDWNWLKIQLKLMTDSGRLPATTAKKRLKKAEKERGEERGWGRATKAGCQWCWQLLGGFGFYCFDSQLSWLCTVYIRIYMYVYMYSYSYSNCCLSWPMRTTVSATLQDCTRTMCRGNII